MGILVDFGYRYSEAEAMGNGLYRGVRGIGASYICDKGNRKNKGVGEGWIRVWEDVRGCEKVCENLRVELSVERSNLDSTRVFSVNHPPSGYYKI